MLEPNSNSVAITMGDPAGVGPEVAVKALSDPDVRRLARWVLIGDAWLIEQHCEEIGCQPDQIVTELADASEDASFIVLDTASLDPGELTIGQVNAACGEAAVAYVARAVDLCQSGQSQAIVTAPLSKEAVVLTGRRKFVGHTEFIADLCGIDEPRMMLVNDHLCVIHVSTHCSLADAARSSSERILRTIELGQESMTRLGWDQPRIAICGLNPHAGENGLFGDEESTRIQPAIEAAHLKGIACEGPFPADTLFMQAVRGKYDLVVAMYHDQGHVPMKLLDFEHTVNVTVGLPIIRTSVDHGTAFDIAGQGIADADDMKTAMRFALRMCQRRQPLAPTAETGAN